MVHRAKELSSGQRLLLEGLLGRSVSEDDSVSVRLVDTSAAPVWLQQSWQAAKQAGVDSLTDDEIQAEISAARDDAGLRTPARRQ